MLAVSACGQGPAPSPCEGAGCGDPCADVVCGEPHRGVCEPLGPETHTCTCDPGFHEGDAGACTDDPCDPDPCVPPGPPVCAADDHGGYTCICDKGYHLDGTGGCTDDPCDPNPCGELHRAVCDATSSTTHTCSCDPGYHDDGEGGCTSDPCVPDPCEGLHASCFQREDHTAACACDPGYHDDGEGGCSDDPCVPNPCDAPSRSICVNGAEGPTCVCDPGFLDDGDGACFDDPCDPNPCDAPSRSVCTVDGADATCACDPGFLDDGDGGCVDDPCDPNPCDAPNRSVCSFTVDSGGPACACDPGFLDDGDGGCVDDPCDPNPCDAPNRSVCSFTVDGGGPACACDPGFLDDGDGGCVDDPCDPNPCDAPNRSICSITAEGGAACACDPGYSQDAEGGCFYDPCTPNPCSTPLRTVCEVIGGAAICYCDPGAIDLGASCAANPCTPNPCTEPGRGVCVVADDASARCECAPDLHEDGAGSCTDDPCLPNPCADGPKTACVADDGATTCQCAEGLYDDGAGGCSPDPCVTGPCTEPHRTRCDSSSGAVVCRCDVGYDDLDGACVPGTCTPDRCEDLPGTVCIGTVAPELACVPCTPPTWGCDPASCTPETLDLDCVCPQAHLDGDAWEPNDCLVFATPIALGETQEHTLSPAGDVDFLSFQATRRDILWIDTSSWTNAFDLLHPNGQTYTEGPRFGVSGGYEVYIEDTGTQFLRLTSLNGKDAPTARAVSVQLVGHDDHGNHPDDGTVLGDTSIAGRLDGEWDVDTFLFRAEEASDFEVRLTGDDADVTAPWVFGARVDGAPTPPGLTHAKDATGAWASLHGGTPGLYAFSVKSGPLGYAYEVDVVDFGPDLHGDELATATALSANGVEVAGTLVGDDEDWFTFDIEGNTDYTLRVTGEGHWVSIYDPDYAGDPLGAVQDIWVGLPSPGTKTLSDLLPGTYAARVRRSADVIGHAYTLSLVMTGPSDGPDDPTLATELVPQLPPGELARAVARAPLDEDWYTFVAQPGHLYRIKYNNLGTVVGLKAALYRDPAGEPFATPETGRAFIHWADSPTPERYYLLVTQSSPAWSATPYELGVVDYGLDDCVDALPGGCPLYLSGPRGSRSGLHESRNEVDMLTFQTAPGHHYRLFYDYSGEHGSLTAFRADGTPLSTEPPGAWDGHDPGLHLTGTGETFYLRASNGDTLYVTARPWRVDVFDRDTVSGMLSADAVELPTDGTVVSGDLPWFYGSLLLRFTAEPGHGYVLVDERDQLFDWDVYLVDPVAHDVVAWRQGPTTVRPLPASAASARTMYFHVATLTELDPDHLNTYRFRLEDRGPDQLADDLTSAVVIHPHAAVTHPVTLEGMGDVDVLALATEPDHYYAITAPGSYLEGPHELLEADGAPIARVSASGDHFRPAQPGPSFLRFPARPYESAEREVVFRDLGVDEPGLERGEGPIVPVGTWIEGVANAREDEDWYLVDLEGRRSTKLEIDGPSQVRAALYVAVEGATGPTPVAETTTSGVLTAGRHAVRVRAMEMFDAGPQPYAFRLVQGSDDVEPDTSEDAVPLVPGVTVTGAIDFHDDEDWFTFAAEPGHRYQVSVPEESGCHVPWHAYHRMYLDLVGTTALNDVVGPLDVDRLWLRLGGVTAQPCAYTLTVTDLGAGPQPEDAALLPADGTTVIGTIPAGAYELNWWRFTLPYPGLWRVVLDYEAPNLSALTARLAIFDPTGAEQERAAILTTDIRAHESLTSLSPGEHVMSVRIPVHEDLDYGIRLTWDGPDDHGDTAETATLIAPDGGEVAGTASFYRDLDCFAFAVSPDSDYVIEVEAAGAAALLRGAVDGDGGERLEPWPAESEDTRAVGLVPDAPGTRWFCVQQMGDDPLPYVARVTRTGLEPGASAATALPLEDGWTELAPRLTPLWLKVTLVGDEALRFIHPETLEYRVVSPDGVTPVDSPALGLPCCLTSTFYPTGYAFVGIDEGVAGTYYLAVDVGRSPQLVRLERTRDDYPDIREDAWPLAVDGPWTAATFETVGDVDWFAFDAEEGLTYRVRAISQGGVVASVEAETGGAPVTVPPSGLVGPLAAGRYALRCQSVYDGDTESLTYAVAVESASPP